MPPSFVQWIAFALVAGPAALYALHRLALWLEASGCLYYRNEKPRGGGGRNALLEVDRLTRPAVEHRIEAEDRLVALAENDGD